MPPAAPTPAGPAIPRPAISREEQFAHLHLHTEYSLLDGGNRIDKLVKRVAELGMTSVGITDHGNIFGHVAFYQACKEKNVKPILGVEAYVTPPGKPRTDRTYTGGGEGGYHLVLLAENLTGWKNLLVLCSEAYLTGFYYKPRIDRELLEKHSEGLIAINGHLGSEIGEHLLEFERHGDQRHWDAAVESAVWHQKAFSGAVGKWGSGADKGKETLPHSSTSPLPHFYIELQHHVADQNSINKHLIRLAKELNLPLVCDNDSHFLRREDHDAHDTLVCISTGKNKDDDQRMHYPVELYVKSPKEMRDLFEQYGEVGKIACDNTVAIAERCNVELPIGANHAPMVRVEIRGKAQSEKAQSSKKGKETDPAAELPRHDDPRYAGDLTAWYKDYCTHFELVPFDHTPTPQELAESQEQCNRALRLLAEGGYVWRYGPDGANGGAGAPAVVDRRARLERELKILADKNISAYFLIVWDFVNWGRQRGIPANARGSGVGTMVGYTLGLSNACPVQYGLLFERFTDPDRSEYPDIDIDLCQDGRGDVINYVRNKYGHVAQIITFGTMKARAAVRDVGRVFNIPLSEVDKVAKLIPETLNITLDEALEQEPDLKKIYDTDDRIRRVLDNARTLEGQARHASVHAAGVIVATRPLQEIVPLFKQPGTEDNAIVTQWDGPTCEKMGLLKMDFLGLRTLSIIERAKKLITDSMTEEEIWEAVGRGGEYEKLKAAKQQSSNESKKAGKSSQKDDSEFAALSSGALSFSHPLDLDRLDYADQTVFELFRRGETTGVFQFESPGMRRLLVEMKPDRLEDLIAANALFRPGPMDLIPDYNRRKHGTEDVPHVHEIVDRYTSETYGVMVYQEQVMQIVHGLGGIKLRDAYTLIKNISKKKHDKIEKERPKFVDGAQKQGLSKQQAENLFELILKFAGYGFNKSHSTGYAIVAYQTAYLKTYFPNHYMAAFLTFESQAQKVSDWISYLEDCKKCRFVQPTGDPKKVAPTVRTGVEVRPPDINLSKADFAVVFEEASRGVPAPAQGASVNTSTSTPIRAHQGHVRFGMKAIKGTGEKAIEAILKERDGETKRQRDEVQGIQKTDGLSHSVSPSLRLSVSTPFSSLFDFCERVPPGAINKSALENLIKCGCFDSVHGRDNRAAMAATIEQAISAGQKLAADKAAGQGALFGFGGSEPPASAGAGGSGVAKAITLNKADKWTEGETLKFEKEILGFFVSSHPMDQWKRWSNVFTTTTIAGVKACQQDARVIVAGIVQGVRTLIVKNGRSAGQKMAVVTVEDPTGSIECVVFADAYARFSHLVETDKIIFVLGRADLSRGEPQLVTDRLVPIEGSPLSPGRLQVLIDERKLNGTSIPAVEKLAAMLRASSPDAARLAANGANGASNGQTNSAANGSPTASTAATKPDSELEALLAKHSLTPFPVELAIGTMHHTAILAAGLRVSLTPKLVGQIEECLGPATCRIVGGVSVDLTEKKPWEKKFAKSGSDD